MVSMSVQATHTYQQRTWSPSAVFPLSSCINLTDNEFFNKDAKDALVSPNSSQHPNDEPHHLVVLGTIKQKSVLF